MKGKVFLLGILMVLSGVISLRSGFVRIVHEDMVNGAMSMNCTPEMPCFTAHMEETPAVVPVVFINLLVLFVLLIIVQVQTLTVTWQQMVRARSGGIFSMSFWNFCLDYIRQGLLSPKLSATL